LDSFGTQIAVCNCLYGVQATVSKDLGAAMAVSLIKAEMAARSADAHADRRSG
jgi:hypothetical protein